MFLSWSWPKQGSKTSYADSATLCGPLCLSAKRLIEAFGGEAIEFDEWFLLQEFIKTQLYSGLCFNEAQNRIGKGKKIVCAVPLYENYFSI